MTGGGIGRGVAVRLPGEPDPKAWRRLALYLTGYVTAVLLILTGLEPWHATPAPKPDLVTGAQGAFPPALGPEPPATPDHVLRRTTADETVVHGLSIRATGVGVGVRAVNIRTGSEYWRYERGGYGDGDLAGDGDPADGNGDEDRGFYTPTLDVSARTVVAGFTDGRLTAIDLRSGRILWHRSISEGESRRGLSFRLTGGEVITETPAGIRALAERTGRTLWTASRPAGCDETPIQTVYDFPDHLVTALVRCDVLGPEQRIGGYDIPPSVTKTSALLLGIHDRTGKVLWRQQHAEPYDDLLRAGTHTLAAVGPERRTPRPVRLLDVSREGAPERTAFSIHLLARLTTGNGIAVTTVDPHIYDTGSPTLLSAYDTGTGRLRWRLRAPTGKAYGDPVVADGRVYVVRQPIFRYADAGHTTSADLLVLDAETGRVGHVLELTGLTVPKDVNAAASLDVRVVGDRAVAEGADDTGGTDGAVAIRWREERDELLLMTDDS
ncbi:PQQ-binding-like beta-propeller repeat protein [Streptomyces pseudovenezuelae]|uniref:outer membrane protein assembly factor BamB family protein n=1 Tax=Streptomyces pseudovenezuelae TaxID=67350 RepID=UPI002475D245|nr:PQQ-binding-like beta-propeller repeat protein [Streptomyces pseudovenezuelae]